MIIINDTDKKNVGYKNLIIGNKAINLIKLNSINKFKIPSAIILSSEEIRNNLIDIEYINQFFKDKLFSIRSSPTISLPGILNTVLNCHTEYRDVGNIPSYLYLEYLNNIQSISLDSMCSIKDIIDTIYQGYQSKRVKQVCSILGINQIDGGIILQEMVYGNLNLDSGTGILFTRDRFGGSSISGEFIFKQQGTKLVDNSNIIAEDIHVVQKISPDLLLQLMQISYIVEKKFSWPQEVEFTIENKDLYILQSRNLTIDNNNIFRVLYDLQNRGIISTKKALCKANKYLKNNSVKKIIDVNGKKFISGISASEGLCQGILGKDIYISKLLRNEDDKILHNITGLITHEGNFTCHIAILCRNLNIPYLIVKNKYHYDKLITFVGSQITLDTYSQRVYLEPVDIDTKSNKCTTIEELLNYVS